MNNSGGGGGEERTHAFARHGHFIIDHASLLRASPDPPAQTRDASAMGEGYTMG